MTTDPRIPVAQNLTAIVELSERLEDQAINDANDALMPGGLAMVALAAVANLEAWGNKLDAAERRARAYGLSLTVDDDDEWEPPLQTLLFWSEDLRRIHDLENEARPTITSEANVIRWALDWLWENEPHFEDFAEDIRKTRNRLENLMLAGARPAFRGAPCMYDECRGKRLIRKTVPTRDEDGNKVWRLTDWHCPKCKRSWSPEDYERNIYAAIERTHWLNLDGEAWATYGRAARHVDRPEGTLRSWVSRGEVGAMCTLEDRRTFVLLGDVSVRDQLARARWLAMPHLHPEGCGCGQHEDAA